MKSLRKCFSTLLVLFLFLSVTANLSACTTGAPTTAITGQTETAPTNIPVPPANTPKPSSTPLPTATLKPTNTPKPIPTETSTETPEPTHTPTAKATNTPKPTATPQPTKTPIPANTPAPTNPPPATAAPQTSTPTPAATAEAGGEEAYIVVYYISNPNDILGEFPVKPFDADRLRSHMTNIQSALNTMQANLDAAKGGDAAACSNYVNAYNNILYSGEFYDDIPGDWQQIDVVYSISFIYALDRTRPAYLACVNGGDMGDFNYGLAYTAIGETLNFLNPAIVSAYAK